MKAKTRKILARIGAGLLLGLSFLNFGSGWMRQNFRVIARRAKNIRKAVKEKLSPEVQEIADIAEEEALKVIQKEAQQQQKQVQVQQTVSQSQVILRYATIAGWGVAMTIFFTSMIFNQPFSLGKMALSLLPGNPHLATLSLQAEKTVVTVGEPIKVDLRLSSGGDPVDAWKAVVNFNQADLDLIKVTVNKDKFNRQEKIDVSEKGIVTVVAGKTGEPIVLKNEVVASLYFLPKKITKATGLSLFREKSLVIKAGAKKSERYNILGKVRGVKLKIVAKAGDALECKKFELVRSRMNRAYWETVLNESSLLQGEKNNFWRDLGNDVFLLCGYSDDNTIYLLLMAPREINDFYLVNKLSGKKIDALVTDTWQKDNLYFYSLLIDAEKLVKEKGERFNNLVVYGELEGKTVRWPERGSGALLLKK